MIGFRQVATARGWTWVERGLSLLRAEPRLWFAMAAIYLAIAVVLELIPFIGRLILILATPLMLLGALGVAAALAGKGLPAGSIPPAPGGAGEWLQYLRALLAAGARRLFHGARDEEKLLPIMVISTLVLGGVVIIQILAQLLKANPLALADTLASGVSSSVWITALLGLTIVLALNTLLAMAFLYTVPLILFRREHPLPSIAASFRATVNSFGAFAVFGGTFVAVSVGSLVLYHWLGFPLDYLAFLAIGFVALPVFVGALYASYQDLFAAPAR